LNYFAVDLAPVRISSKSRLTAWTTKTDPAAALKIVNRFADVLSHSHQFFGGDASNAIVIDGLINWVNCPICWRGRGYLDAILVKPNHLA